MAHRLRRIRLRELSFVDAGASGDAENRPRIALWKRKPEQPHSQEKPMKFTKAIAQKVMQAVQLIKEGEPKAAQAVLDGIKSKLDEAEWAMVEMMIAGAAPMPVASAAPPAAEEPAPKPEDPTVAKANAEKQAAEVAKALAGILNPSEPDAMAKLAKSSPELAAVLAQFEKRAADAEAKVKETAEKLEKSEKERADEFQKARAVRFQKLAETELKLLPGKPEDIAKRLADLEDALEPEDFKKHLEMLKASCEHIAKAKTLTPRGASGADTEGSAYAQITKLAEELVAKDPKLSIAKARTMVTKNPANVELIKRYRAEQ